MKVNAITIWFRRNRKIRTVSVSYPVVIDDGNTVGWFDAQENITKDDSNFVSVWGDKSGLSHNLLQLTGTNQPLWSANGILFDGIDNFMKCAAFTWNQPEFIYIVWRRFADIAGTYVFDGNTGIRGVLYRASGGTNVIQAYAGLGSGGTKVLDFNTWGIVRVLFNGVSSKLIINNGTPLDGNFGANNMGGFTLGSSGTGLSAWANIEVKEIIGRESVLGEAEIYAYYATKYAAILP